MTHIDNSLLTEDFYIYNPFRDHIFLGKVMLLRYEDLSLTPVKTFKKILNFLDLPWVKNLEKYLTLHTKQDNSKRRAHDTTRNSTAAVLLWTNKMQRDKVSLVQNACGDLMTHMAYKQVNMSKDVQLKLEDIMVL